MTNRKAEDPLQGKATEQLKKQQVNIREPVAQGTLLYDLILEHFFISHLNMFGGSDTTTEAERVTFVMICSCHIMIKIATIVGEFSPIPCGIWTLILQ